MHTFYEHFYAHEAQNSRRCKYTENPISYNLQLI